MTPVSIRRWASVHRWTSLVCTLFLLMLCLTGLPLIFQDEINRALGDGLPPPPPAAAGVRDADLDEAARIIAARHPGQRLADVIWVDKDPGTIWFNMSERGQLYRTDRQRLAELPADYRGDGTLIGVLREIHGDLFLGLPGRLFLGAMGLLFVIAIVSGVVLYAPFMRRLRFGEVRAASRRVQWLDRHNLLGIVALGWTLVVGVTGAINAVHDQLIDVWRADQLTQLAKPYAGKPPLRDLASLQQALGTAMRAAPGAHPLFLSLPGSSFSTPHHFTLWMQGSSPATNHLYKVVMLDAATGELSAVRSLPWYMTVMFVAEPLHFGDYAGLPLKMMWAAFTLITIMILGSGIYLWVSKMFRPSGLGQLANGQAA